jgi:hypothetical protein
MKRTWRGVVGSDDGGLGALFMKRTWRGVVGSDDGGLGGGTKLACNLTSVETVLNSRSARPHDDQRRPPADYGGAMSRGCM